jgi:hypothetical protein
MSRIGKFVLALGAAGILAAAAGCGDDDDDGDGDGINPGTPCEEMIYDICQAACECTEDCAWSVGAVHASSTDLKTCYDMEIAFGTCDGLEMDFEACSGSISQDQCVEGSFGLELALGEECDGLS